MTYPLFILCFAFLVVLGVVFFLIPKFEEMFSQAGAQLPLLTRMVVGASHFAIQMWPYMLGFAIVGVFAFKKALKIRSFRYQCDKYILRIPIIGKMLFTNPDGPVLPYAERFALRRRGLVDIAGYHVQSCAPPSRRERDRLHPDKVVAGANMSDEIRAQKVFPGLVGKMVAVGERTGTIDEMLKRTAQYYDDELDNIIQKLTSLIEPVLIIFIGGFICIIIVALYLPIFNVTKLVS